MSTLSDIPCTYKQLCGLRYECYVDGQNIPRGPVILQGAHCRGKSKSDVTWLEFQNCNFVEFPRNLQRAFPHLTDLWINDCRLTSIARDQIGQWRSLKTFHVISCDLRRLPGDLFNDLRELEFISFYNNKLCEISPELLDGLYRLKRVNFKRNANIDMEFGPRCVTSLDDIKSEIRLRCQPNAEVQRELAQQGEQITLLEERLERLVNVIATDGRYRALLELM